MRRAFLVLAFSASLAAPAARAAQIEFVRVWPGWRTAESFDRISEYFTGHEAAGSETILRTHAAVRAGFYYLVRVANSGTALARAKFSLQIIAPTSPEPTTYIFPVELAARATVFELGLTGADWPDKKTHPVAWRLDLLAADGRILATAKSFLWEKPAQ